MKHLLGYFFILLATVSESIDLFKIFVDDFLFPDKILEPLFFKLLIPVLGVTDLFNGLGIDVALLKFELVVEVFNYFLTFYLL